MHTNGSGCIHWWIIDSPEKGFRGQDNRFYVQGQCKKCLEHRYFITEFADIDYVASNGSHMLGVSLDRNAVVQKYEFKPREIQNLTPNTNNARMTGYEREGCGYDCIDSLNCPYAVCIHDNPRIAHINANVDDIKSLSTHQRMNYIRILSKQGLSIEDIIGATGIPYQKVWTALATPTHKATKSQHDLEINELRKKGYSYSEIATMIAI